MGKVLIGLCLLLSLCIPVSAYNASPMGAAAAEAFLENSVPNEFLSEEGARLPFQTFALSEGGQVALVMAVRNSLLVHVYDGEGTFRYGYRLVDAGQVVFFEGEELSVFWVKSGCIETLDDRGNTIRLRTAWNTGENAERSRRHQNPPASSTVGAVSYRAEKDFPCSTTYSRFLLKAGPGTERVIYDVSAGKWERAAGAAVVAVLFGGVALLICRGRIYRSAAGRRHGTSPTAPERPN